MASSSSDASGGAGSAASPVTLVSSEKHKFVVERKAAMVSGLIRTMLESGPSHPSGTLTL